MSVGPRPARTDSETASESRTSRRDSGRPQVSRHACMAGVRRRSVLRRAPARFARPRRRRAGRAFRSLTPGVGHPPAVGRRAPSPSASPALEHSKVTSITIAAATGGLVAAAVGADRPRATGASSRGRPGPSTGRTARTANVTGRSEGPAREVAPEMLAALEAARNGASPPPATRRRPTARRSRRRPPRRPTAGPK